jgi:DNA repair exonuclease SbcCD ATPase subunit
VATEDDIKAAVEKATADAVAKIAELEAKLTSADRAANEATVAELQSKLDEAVAARKTAEEDLTAKLAYLEAEHTRVSEAEAATARRGQRLDEVRATAVFPDTYVEENADRWARLNEDDWSTQLGEYQAIAAARPAPSDTPVVEAKPAPALTAVAAVANDSTDRKSAVAEVFALRTSGIDLRQII